MCANCGCQGDKATVVDLQTGDAATIPVLHQHEGAVLHSHSHGSHHHADNHDGPNHHAHDHHGPHQHAHEHHGPHRHLTDEHAHGAPPSAGVTIVDMEMRILAKNDALAAKNRAWFAGREILALNLVSSPGAGKTTLLERTIRDLAGELPLYVIEGDQATAKDGERIRSAGASVVQINTGTGCHLDADMVARAVPMLKPGPGAVVLIENVGNLVCPALFDLGERAKVVMFSVTEGEDKPLKYPYMFRAATIVILGKVDLLPHLDFSVAEAIANVRRVNPEAKILQISSQTGEGTAGWYDWLRSELSSARQSTFA
jgi:hydrogenase nickel incorporation protein HypB